MNTNVFGDLVETQVNAFGDPVGVDHRPAPEQNLMQQLETAPRFTIPETFTPTPPGGMKMPTAGTELAGGFMDFARFAPLSKEAWTGQPPQGNIAGVYEGLAKQATPENAAIIALAAPTLMAKAAGTALGPVVDPVITGIQSLIKAYFATQGAGMAGQELGRAMYEPELSPGQRTEALFNTVLGGSLAVPGFLPMLDRGAKPSGLGKGDIQSKPTTADFADMTGRELIGPERQLVGPRGEYVVDPLMQVQAKADVDPLGGQTPYQTVEPKKSFSGDVPILGKQPQKVRFPMVIEDPVQLERAYQAAGEPKQGGQISFAAEASARGVPDARQPSAAPLGSEMLAEIQRQEVTGPDAQSYRAPRPAPTPEEVAKRKARESVEQGMHQPSGMYTGDETLPYAKEQQFPEHGGPEGTFSQLQRSRIQAGQPNVRAMQQNNPPGMVSMADALEKASKQSGAEKPPGGAAPHDAASLPAGARMIEGEGQSSTPSGKAAHIEDAIEQRGPQGGNISSLGFLDPAFWKSQLGIAKSAKVDAQQLYNRMRNKLGETSTAWEMLKDNPEFKKFMTGVKSPEEVEKWIGESGPRVEVRKFGEGGQTPTERRQAELTHQLDTEFPGYLQKAPSESEAYALSLSPEKRQRLIKLATEHSNVTVENLKGENRGERAHWSSIAPKAEKDMPGYVEIAVVKPAKQVFQEGNTGHGVIKYKGDEVQFPSSHSFPPNTLGFVRGYMEGDTFHVIEVQSDWAKHTRDYRQKFPENAAKQEVGGGVKDDPLLRHWERLAVKAAIEHAREAGAKKIAFQDAESAMLMEGHDQVVNQGVGRTETARRIAQGDIDNLISQAKGMRLHYDTILPKIAEELTGSKGERGSFGEHKMAVSGGTSRLTEGYQSRSAAENAARLNGIDESLVTQLENGDWGIKNSVYRKDLIFRNPDGTPKTDVSGLVYDLKGAKEDFSYTGKDKAPAKENTSGRLYMNPVGPMLDQLGKDAREVWDKLTNNEKEHVTSWFKVEADRREAIGMSRIVPVQALNNKLNEIATSKENAALFAADTAKAQALRQERRARMTPQQLEQERLHNEAYLEVEKMQYKEDLQAWRRRKTRAENKGLEFDEERPSDPTLSSVEQKAADVKEEKTGMRVDPSRRGESGSIINPFKPRKRERQINTKQFQTIQKFFDYGKEVRDATTPQGIGRVPGLSRLFDPRAYRTTPDGKAIIANAVMSQKGQNFAALWQETHKDVVRAFEDVPNFGDVIEAELRNPGSQKLNPNQTKFVNEWAAMRKKVVGWAQSEGVMRYVDEHDNVIPLNEFYFPRPAVGKVGLEQTVRDTVKQTVGGIQFMQKKRWYESEAEGTKAEIKYDPDEYSRIGRWMTGIYKAVADQRMADDPALAGVRDKGSARFLTEGKVFQPAFAGRIYSKEVANRLNKYYGESTHDWVKNIANINDALKSVEFTMDVSAPVNQGLPMMGSHPLKWAKTTLRSYQAMLDDRVMNRYLQDKDNARIAREIIANGGSLVRLQDFLQGANKGKWAEKVPPIRASARSMGTFFSLAKIELYRAYEPIAKKNGWSTAELVEAVENSVLSGKMENLGLTRGRALGERLLFNAPSYIRGAFNLIAMAGLGIKDVATGKSMRISGRVANRALAGLATAVMLQMYALYKMKGLSDEEIEKRFDIREGSFLKYPHMMSNGVVKEVGYNNFIIGLARVLGDTAEVAQGTKEVGTGMDNPWIRWASYRKSPLGNLVWQYGTGMDYRGEEIGMMEATAKAAMPIAAEPFTERDTTEDKTKGPVMRRFSEGRMKGAAAQFLGLSTYDESPGAYRGRQQDILAKEKFDKPTYSLLTKGERRQVTGEAESRMKAMAPPPTPRMVMGAQKQADLRRKAVVERLDPGVQKWLTDNGLRAGGYSESTTINAKEVRLANREEREQLRDLMAEQVNYRLSRLTNRVNVSQKDVDLAMGLARERAWMLMGRLLGTKPSAED